MAYREFHNEKTYEAPETQRAMEIHAQSVGRLFQNIARQQQAKRNLDDQFKYGLEYGQFENDNKIIGEYVNTATSQARSDFRNYGRLSPQTQVLMQQGNEFAANSKAQAQRIKQLWDSIHKKADDDPYYDYTEDERLLKDVSVGADGEMNAYNRGKEIDKISGVIGNNPKSFKRINYTADYVNKLMGEKSKATKSGDPKIESESTIASPFLDYKTGKNEVTDEHAVRYINSRGDVGRELDMRMNDILTDEIKRMKASGDLRIKWMDGLNDVQIKNELIQDPSKNIINTQEYGQRKRELAKQDLREAAKMTEKVSYETKRDMSKTNGLYDNDKIAIGDFQENQNIGTGKNFTPGYTLQIASGATNKPITLNQSTSSLATNARTGEFTDFVGGQDFNLKSTQVQVFDNSGRAVLIDANDLNEFRNKLNGMTDADFKNLQPEMSIALRGYTVNKGKVLGEISKRREDLETQLAKAKDIGDNERIAILEDRLASLDGAVQDINGSADEFSDDDVLSTLRENNIDVSSIYNDLLVKAGDSDLSFINSVTEGLNLKDQNKWSPAMRQANQIYKARYAKALASQFGGYTTQMNEVISKRQSKTSKKTDKFPLPSGQPKTVEQNGYTYTWNPNTGQYE